MRKAVVVILATLLVAAAAAIGWLTLKVIGQGRALKVCKVIMQKAGESVARELRNATRELQNMTPDEKRHAMTELQAGGPRPRPMPMSSEFGKPAMGGIM